MLKKKKNLLLLIFLVIIIVYSFLSIDYSSARFSLSFARTAITGLFSPDWSFVSDGTSEDLLSLLLLTLSIAFLGTTAASIMALPLSILSANNLILKNIFLSKFGKFICNLLRAFPELIYAIVFVTIVGPGAFAGVLAIMMNQIGMLGKLYTDEWEAINNGPIEAMNAVGANTGQLLFYAQFPQVSAKFLSLSLNHFEIALRSASILGLVGAGGLGAPIIFAIQARNWSRVGIILLGVILTILAVDAFSGYLRKKLQ